MKEYENIINELPVKPKVEVKKHPQLNERYTFLSTQRDDLENSVTSLLSVIEEMDELIQIL